MILKGITIGHFRARMERLQLLHSGGQSPSGVVRSEWESSSGERLVFQERRQWGYDYSKPPKLWGLPPFQQEKWDIIDVTPPERGTWVVWVRLTDGELDEERGAIITAFETGGQTEVEFIDGAAGRKPIGASFQEFKRLICEVDMGNGIVLQRGKPGRTPDPSYDEAYQRILNGESVEDAFKWFCDEEKIAKPDKGIRDSFKAALKRRQNKT